MDDIQIQKEKIINNYFSSIDLKNINIEQIKQELKTLIGEEPAIKLNYEKTEKLNEATGEKIIVENLKSLTVIYTIEKTIGDKDIPFPVQKNILLK